MLFKRSYIFFLLLFSSVIFSNKDNSTLLIYGDSISAGYGMSANEQWSVILQNKINAESLNIKVVNASVSGETTSGGLVRINQVINSTKPDYLLLELGGNDALRGYPPKKISSNLSEMIKIAQLSNIKVLVNIHQHS